MKGPLACGSSVPGNVNLILVARVSVVNLGPRFKFFSWIVWSQFLSASLPSLDETGSHFSSLRRGVM